MKKNEIVVGGLYKAKVSGNVVTVKVEAIREYFGGVGFNNGWRYDVLNTATGRRTTFRSAAKFRSEVNAGSMSADGGPMYA